MEADNCNNKEVEHSSKVKDENDKKADDPFDKYEKIIQLNKLGGLCLAGGSNEKAISILSKTLAFYEDMLQKKEIPPFFYGNLYCNLAKALSVAKRFDEAEVLYRRVLKSHPISNLMIKAKDFLLQEYFIEIDKLLEIRPINESDLTPIIIRHKKMIETFEPKEEKFQLDPIKGYKKNNLNSISSYADTLINLAVVLQIKYKESVTAFEMYYLAVLCEPENEVGNIDYNNFLRENNLKPLSDEFIIQRIKYDNFHSKLSSKIPEPDNAIALQQIHANIWKGKPVISFVCMKWGTKYGCDYVNKLYNGVKRCYSETSYDFWCITENKEGLNEEIKIIDLNCNFKGWMKKAYLFSKDVNKNFGRKVCFIDLDMIIYGDISYLGKYEGDFLLMSTNDIKCENSKEGYNSSIILWRNGVCDNIYQFLEKYHQHITKQVIRFDHYLEFIVKNSDFAQSEFPNQVLDYNTYCKDKVELPSEGSIIAFPRYPKPHECSEVWVEKYWI